MSHERSRIVKQVVADRIVAGAGLCSVLVMLAGCHATYDKVLEHRQETIHRTIHDHFVREADRPVSIERVGGYASELQEIYRQRLENALILIEEKSRARNESFWAGDPQRDAQFEDNARGDGQSIDWAVQQLTP